MAKEGCEIVSIEDIGETVLNDEVLQKDFEEVTDAEIVGVAYLGKYRSCLRSGWNLQVEDWADAQKMNARCCKSMIGVPPTFQQSCYFRVSPVFRHCMHMGKWYVTLLLWRIWRK